MNKQGSKKITVWWIRLISHWNNEKNPFLCILLFSSAHTFSMGFRSGDYDGHLILCSANHFCVDLDICFGSLSCWKIQQRPCFSFMAGATRFRLKMSWYFMFMFMMACTLTRFPGPLEQKQPHNLTDHPPCLTVGIRLFSVSAFFLRQKFQEHLMTLEWYFSLLALLMPVKSHLGRKTGDKIFRPEYYWGSMGSPGQK